VESLNFGVLPDFNDLRILPVIQRNHYQNIAQDNGFPESFPFMQKSGHPSTRV